MRSSDNPPRFESLGGGCPPISLSYDECDAFRPHLRGVLAPLRQLAVIASPECFRLPISCDGDLTAEHHDPHVEIVCVHVFCRVGLLPSMNDLEAFPAQVAFECLTGEGAAVAASA
jgi:hypothetical protein